MERNPETVALDRADLKAALEEFEDRHDLDILSVRPYGSHAKNMAGPESDHDIMFIYRQEPMAYVEELGNRVGTIHTKEYGYDFQGWNIDKFGGLLKDSNPQCLEFLNSPIEYHYLEEPTLWLDKLKAHANEQFKPIALYYHYRDMAKSNYMKYLAKTIHDGDGTTMLVQDETEDEWIVNTEEDFYPSGWDHHAERTVRKDSDHFTEGTTEQTVNRTLRVLRSILYARHVRKTHTFPTMDFMSFMSESDVITADDSTAIVELIKMKRRGNKTKEIDKERYTDLIEQELRHEPDHEELNVRGIDRELVNEFITEMVKHGRDGSP